LEGGYVLTPAGEFCQNKTINAAFKSGGDWETHEGNWMDIEWNWWNNWA
jgi:hypothetical protein